MAFAAMSNKVLGTGIIATGLLILAIALIMGLEFPKYIFRENVEDLCILGYDHPKFQIWVSIFFIKLLLQSTLFNPTLLVLGQLMSDIKLSDYQMCQ